MYIYRFNLSVVGIPNQIHSRRVSALILIFIGVYKFFNNSKGKLVYQNNSFCYKQFIKYFKVCILITIYALYLFITIGKSGEGVHLFEYMLNICLFSLPVTWALFYIFNNIDEFAKILVCVGIVQSLFIIACLADATFANFIDITFNDTGTSDFNSAHRYGYAGGIDCITATGVIKYSTSLLAATYLYCKTKRSLFLFVFFLFAIINSMIARTGILFDFICFVYILIAGINKKVILNFGVPMLLVGGIVYYVISDKDNEQFINERYQRAITLSEDKADDKFFQDYLAGDYPPLSSETFMGVGMISGKSANGYNVNIDGGPLRVYSAIGILFSIIFYIYIFRVLYKCQKIQQVKLNRSFMLLVAIIYLLGDIKEMNFLSMWQMSIYFLFAVLVEKDSKYCLIQ